MDSWFPILFSGPNLYYHYVFQYSICIQFAQWELLQAGTSPSFSEYLHTFQYVAFQAHPALSRSSCCPSPRIPNSFLGRMLFNKKALGVLIAIGVFLLPDPLNTFECSSRVSDRFNFCWNWQQGGVSSEDTKVLLPGEGECMLDNINSKCSWELENWDWKLGLSGIKNDGFPSFGCP